MLKVGWYQVPRPRQPGSWSSGACALWNASSWCPLAQWIGAEFFLLGKCSVYGPCSVWQLGKVGAFSEMGISMSWWFKAMGISMFWCWNVVRNYCMRNPWSLQHVVAPGSTPGLSRIDWKSTFPNIEFNDSTPTTRKIRKILAGDDRAGLTSSMNTFPQTLGSTWFKNREKYVLRYFFDKTIASVLIWLWINTYTCHF